MVEESSYYERRKTITIVCKEIDKKYSYHRRLTIGKNYYTKKFSENPSDTCNVYTDEECNNYYGSYWCWMFYSLAQHRQDQIDSIFG
jgi:hypothetical protein